MTSVFVIHPSLQHSHQLAWALYERGLLQAFWSGVPVVSDGEKLPFWLPQSYASKVKTVAIPPELRRHPMYFQALLRAGALLPKGFSGDDYAHRNFHWYDWWVAQHIGRLKPKVVVAYENSAYHTFRSAKAIGARCILDAPSLHHVSQEKLLAFKQTPYLPEINRRKDEEVALADLILTCAPLAAESYVENGVSASKVQSMLLGATVPEALVGWEKHNKPLRFIFAGGLRRLKSIDIILKVFERLNIEGFAYQLDFVGGEAEKGWVAAINNVPHSNYLGSVSQRMLFEHLAQSDCLLLPSRFDSFGMVVAEAMACGTPAIVSTQTGAKAMIEKYPQSGWIVDCDAEALYACVKARIQNRAALFAAREFALEAAQDFTWQAYRTRVGNYIEAWL